MSMKNDPEYPSTVRPWILLISTSYVELTVVEMGSGLAILLIIR